MPHTRSTHTIAELDVTASTYDEIHRLLTDAGYTHAFRDGVIDMTGIGLTRAPNVSIATITRIDADGTRTTLPPHYASMGVLDP